MLRLKSRCDIFWQKLSPEPPISAAILPAGQGLRGKSPLATSLEQALFRGEEAVKGWGRHYNLHVQLSLLDAVPFLVQDISYCPAEGLGDQRLGYILPDPLKPG